MAAAARGASALPASRCALRASRRRVARVGRVSSGADGAQTEEDIKNMLSGGGGSLINDHLARRKARLAAAKAAEQAEKGPPSIGELEQVAWPLGEGKSQATVQVLVPSRAASEEERKKLYGEGGALGGLFSRVIWPSGQSLARLLVDEPEMVRGKRVLEVGCGLGLPSCAAVAAGAASVFCADYDGEAAAAAARSAGLNGAAEVRGAALDWNTPGSWPQGEFDVALGADVLYSMEFSGPVAATLAAVLAPGGVALLTDPRDRAPYRGRFADFCTSQGLECTVRDVPDKSIVLIEVRRSE